MTGMDCGRVAPRPTSAAVVGVLVLAAAWAGGCGIRTSANAKLNSLRTPLEARARNHTRATTAADVAPIDAADGDRVRPTDPQAAAADGRTALPEGPTTSPDADGPDTRPDGYFVGLALSGGGSRSANFSAACMFQLQRLGMLEHVDYISSVSGGSLTAAYYCLHEDDRWNPGAVQKKLTHSFATDLIVQTFLPWNLPLLWFSDFDRSDILADNFTRVLFSRKGKALTFAHLRPDRPRLLINATDMQSGRRFLFCDRTFDELNSDLSKYPISYAVAASAAVPVVMHHVTLRDFSTGFKQYRHLVDGGITDNLGVQTLVETYTAHIETAARQGRPDPYPHGAVLIVLDARTQFDARLSDKGDITFLESLSTGAGLTSTALLNRVSSATLAEIVVSNSDDSTTAGELRRQINQLEKGGSLTLRGRSGRPVRVIHLGLSHVDDLTSLPFHSFRERVNNIATYFNIDPTEAFHLYQAAELLVRERFEKELVQVERDIREGRGLSPAPASLRAPATRPATRPAGTE